MSTTGAKTAEQWVFPNVTSGGRTGTVRVTRVAREGLRFNRETNTVSVVTYYDATWRGADGKAERFVITPESLESLRHPPATAGDSSHE